MKARLLFNSTGRLLKPLLFLALLIAAPAASLSQQQNADADTGIGLQAYPSSILLEERTRLFAAQKPANRLAAAAYHSAAELKTVVKYFKAQAEKRSLPAGSDPIVTALFRDNWKIEKRSVQSSNSIFGIQRDVLMSVPQLGAQPSQSRF